MQVLACAEIQRNFADWEKGGPLAKNELAHPDALKEFGQMKMVFENKAGLYVIPDTGLGIFVSGISGPPPFSRQEISSNKSTIYKSKQHELYCYIQKESCFRIFFKPSGKNNKNRYFKESFGGENRQIIR